MNGLFRFIAKLIGRSPSGAAERSSDPPLRTPETATPSPEALALRTALPAPLPSSSPRLAPEQAPKQTVVELDLTEDEDVADDPDDESDEPDPTVGRYEELHVEVLDAEEIVAQRAAAEAAGLSGPHKIFPHDPAGPGSLAETLARLEAQGRVTSRVCDDPEAGFYVLYEPDEPAAKI